MVYLTYLKERSVLLLVKLMRDVFVLIEAGLANVSLVRQNEWQGQELM